MIAKLIERPLIGSNPKVLCDFSDITALSNAILATTGIVTYSGPHYSTSSQILHAEYTVEYFAACLISDVVFAVPSGSFWTDDAWYLEQDNRILEPSEGYLVIHDGQAEGRIVGGQPLHAQSVAGDRIHARSGRIDPLRGG